MEKEDYEWLGCADCKFADKKAMAKMKPCCTHPLGPLPSEDGRDGLNLKCQRYRWEAREV
jgi:hypothetical protein